MGGRTDKMKKDRYSIDMVEGPLFPKILLFSIPLVLTNLLQLTFNAADTIVVGRFGSRNSIAAVGSTASMLNFIISISIGMSIGTSVLVSKYFGAKRKKDLTDTVHTSIMLAIMLALVVSVLGQFVAKPALHLMGSPDDVIDLSVLYVRIYFAGFPGILLYTFGSAILRAVGDTRRPLMYLTLSGVVNVCLNLVFVIVFHLDVAGVALATIISQLISAILVIRCLMKTEEEYRLDIRKLAITKDRLFEIIRVGVPAGLQSSLFSVSNMLIQSTVNTFGSTVMSGNATSGSIEGFIYTTMNAMYQASISFTGQNYGAGRFDRIKKVLLECLLTVTVIGVVMGLLARFFAPQLLGIYTTDPEVIRYGTIRLTLIASTYFLCGWMDVLCGCMRGLGYAVLPMIVSLVGACGFRILWIFTVFPLDPTIRMLYVSYPISWALTAVAHLICFILCMRKVKSIWKRRITV